MQNIMRSSTLRWLFLAGAVTTAMLPILCSLAVGGEPPPLIVTDSGYWYVLVGEDGQPCLQKVETIIRVQIPQATPGPAPDPQPTPTPTPVPSPPVVELLPDVVERTRVSAISVGKWDDSQRLGLVYDAMADHLSAGKLTLSTVWTSVVKGTEIITRASGTESAWQPWREELGRVTGDLTRAGILDDKEEVHRYLKSVVAGLQASVPPEAAKLSLGEGVKVLEICNGIVQATSRALGGEK